MVGFIEVEFVYPLILEKLQAVTLVKVSGPELVIVFSISVVSVNGFIILNELWRSFDHSAVTGAQECGHRYSRYLGVHYCSVPRAFVFRVAQCLINI